MKLCGDDNYEVVIDNKTFNMSRKEIEAGAGKVYDAAIERLEHTFKEIACGQQTDTTMGFRSRNKPEAPSTES